MGPARVLLVDDDQLFIRRVQRALDGSMDVKVATTSCDALTKAANWTPDVVVIDSVLGDADSFCLLDELRASWRNADVGVICVSKGAGAETRFQIVDDGFFGMVLRDAGSDGVCAALRHALTLTKETSRNDSIA